MTRPILTAPALLLALAATTAHAQDHDNPAQPGTHELGATVDAFTDTEGEKLYRIACSGCHGPGGGGAWGAAKYPPLAGNQRLSSARYPVNLIIEGNGAMPSFADWLDDEQVASVVNYIRTNLGNRYEDEITAEQVARMRREFAEIDGG